MINALTILSKDTWIQPKGHLNCPDIVVNEGFNSKPLEWYKENFGGDIKRKRLGPNAGKQQWYIAGEEALSLLVALQPYLWGRNKVHAATWFK